METSTQREFSGDVGVDMGKSMEDVSAALLDRYNKNPDMGPVEEVKPEPVKAEAEVIEVEDDLEKEPTDEQLDADTEDAVIEEAEETFNTVSELAEATGQTLEDFLSSINLTTKVNGEETEVSLATLQKGYQLESDYTRKHQALLAEQKEFTDSREKAQTELAAELQKAGQAFGMAQQQLTHEFNIVNWVDLQKEDPTKYMIQRQLFGERQAQINHSIDEATAQAQQLSDKQASEAETANQEYLLKQDELLLSAIPEWKDSEKRNKEAEGIVSHLSSAGFSPEEIHGIRDHRYILLIREAMKVKDFASDVDVALKKVKQVHKLSKPGAKPQVNAQQQTVTKLHKKLKKSGDLNDVSAILLARGK